MAALLGLLRIAGRNLLLRRINLVIGGLVFLGTVLLVVGSAMISSIGQAMGGSITGSLIGELTVYSSQSHEALEGFQNPIGLKLAPIEDYPRVKKALLGLENVQAVVPVTFGVAWMVGGNSMDRLLERLREAVRAQQEHRETPEDRARREALAQHVRYMAGLQLEDLRRGQSLVDPGEELRHLERATSGELWSTFEDAPYPVLEFLENRVAPQFHGDVALYISYVGTDPASYQQAFPKMEIVDGTAIPAGQRGLLIPKAYYEDVLKVKVARNFDRLHQALTVEGRRIAREPALERLVKQTRAQVPEILVQLDPTRTREAAARLQRALRSKKTGLEDLLRELLDLNNANFAERYRIFYSELAPLLELYRVRVGDVLALKSQARSGYVQSTTVKLYGTYRFRGLEQFPMLRSLCQMDLVTFRELYGYPTPEQAHELKSLEEAARVEPLTREQAEARLADAAGQGDDRSDAFDDSAVLDRTARELRGRAPRDAAYSPGELDSGVVLSAAIRLKDPGRQAETLEQIRALDVREKLGISPLPWQKGAGFLGQIMTVARLVLYVVAFVIFLVMAIIINNSTLLVTLQRIPEIGTLRAMGAQRSSILLLVLLEAGAVGAVFGLLGAGVGAWLMHRLASGGVPAPAEVAYFFFGGPRLFPALHPLHVVAPLLTVVLVTVAAALYPAVLATRIPPVRAMQNEE